VLYTSSGFKTWKSSSSPHILCLVWATILVAVAVVGGGGVYTFRESEDSSLGLLGSEDGGNISFETSITIYQSTKLNIPEDLNLHQHRCESHPISQRMKLSFHSFCSAQTYLRLSQQPS
jgi:hypothetical protein